MNEKRAIRIKHTEIELPPDEERLIEIVVGLLSSSGATPLGVRLGPQQIEAGPPAAQVIEQPTMADAAEPAVPEKRTSRRVGGTRRPTEDSIHPSRRSVIDGIVQPDPSDDAFNSAVKKAKGVGGRALVVLYLGRERADVSALAIPEVASILDRKFRIPLSLNQVSLAMVRMAAKKDDPLIRGSEASWDKTKTEYWLTEAGLNHVKGVVSN